MKRLLLPALLLAAAVAHRLLAPPTASPPRPPAPPARETAVSPPPTAAAVLAALQAAARDHPGVTVDALPAAPGAGRSLRVLADGPPAALLGWLEAVLGDPGPVPGIRVTHVLLGREGLAGAAARLTFRLGPGGLQDRREEGPR